jgi:hypothetical protein
MAVKEKILEKLLKLRNLATKNNSPEEAANAASKFQDLLFQHNLTENDVQDIDNAPIYEKEYYDLKVKTAKWRVALISTIAKNNFCKIVLTGTSRVIIVGQGDNREVVKYLYEYLATELNRLCKLGVKEAKKENTFLDGNLWNKSFYIGAVFTISDRLDAQKTSSVNKANEENTGTGTALALKIDNALRDAITALVGPTKLTQTRRQSISLNGYSAGMQAGNGVKLNQEFSNRRMALNG